MIALEAHLPVLQVVIPLLTAPLCVLIRHPRTVWFLACAVSGVVFYIACNLLIHLQEGGDISYALGGWPAPWGIEYRVDLLNALVLIVVSGISTVTLVYGRDSLEREVEHSRIYLLYTAWLLCLTGLLGMTVTADAFNVFVFLEISSLSTYLLVALCQDKRSLIAAFQYLVMGTIGASFLLIGIGLMYQMTGTLNMADLSTRLPSAAENRTVVVAIGFTLLGIAIKAAVFPVHLWLPKVYVFAPSAVSAFLAGTATKVSVYLLIRFSFSVFGIDSSLGDYALVDLFLILALAGCVGASLMAMYATELKKLLAYSSVAQVGYMIIGMSLANVSGLSAALIHIFNHALIKTTLFMVAGCIVFRTGVSTIADLAGLGKRMPITMAALVIGGLSLIGVPLSAGFISKWYFLSASIERGWWLVAGVIVLSSLMAVVYVWRVVEVVYFRKPQRLILEEIKEVPLLMCVPLCLLAGANVYFGVFPGLVTATARAASSALLGVAP